MVAADAGRVILMVKVFRRQRHAAGMAHGMASRLQIVINRNPVVEDETFALPAALLTGNLLEIAKNATL